MIRPDSVVRPCLCSFDNVYNSPVAIISEQFFAVTILLLAMTTIASVLVMNAHFRGLRGHRPPRWIRNLFLHQLSKFVCMRKVVYSLVS